MAGAGSTPGQIWSRWFFKNCSNYFFLPTSRSGAGRHGGAILQEQMRTHWSVSRTFSVFRELDGAFFATKKGLKLKSFGNQTLSETLLATKLMVLLTFLVLKDAKISTQNWATCSKSWAQKKALIYNRKVLLSVYETSQFRTKVQW